MCIFSTCSSFLHTTQIKMATWLCHSGEFNQFAFMLFPTHRSSWDPRSWTPPDRQKWDIVRSYKLVFSSAATWYSGQQDNILDYARVHNGDTAILHSRWEKSNADSWVKRTAAPHCRLGERKLHPLYLMGHFRQIRREREKWEYIGKAFHLEEVPLFAFVEYVLNEIGMVQCFVMEIALWEFRAVECPYWELKEEKRPSKLQFIVIDFEFRVLKLLFIREISQFHIKSSSRAL